MNYYYYLSIRERESILPSWSDLIENQSIQHKKKRGLRKPKASHNTELGGATLPHLLTMGDGCPFRPQILLDAFYASLL